MSQPICAYCGGHVLQGGDSTRHWHSCDTCSAKLVEPTWPGTGISPRLHRAAMKFDEDDWQYFCDAEDDAFPPPTDALRKAMAGAPRYITLTLTQDDLDRVRTAIFATAWASPEDSSQESEWLALEQRLWRQDPRARQRD